ncbi:hypothetical protein M0802_007215 [Mischocyttarus mexicanus]|nr:hypothetical protein M0802_007215 [Mischocyttarus mexicanus]
MVVVMVVVVVVGGWISKQVGMEMGLDIGRKRERERVQEKERDWGVRRGRMVRVGVRKERERVVQVQERIVGNGRLTSAYQSQADAGYRPQEARRRRRKPGTARRTRDEGFRLAGQAAPCRFCRGLAAPSVSARCAWASGGGGGAAVAVTGGGGAKVPRRCRGGALVPVLSSVFNKRKRSFYSDCFSLEILASL